MHDHRPDPLWRGIIYAALFSAPLYLLLIALILRVTR